MNEPAPSSCLGHAGDGSFPVLRRVMICQWVLLLVMVGAGWFLVDRKFAQSVLVGGVLGNGSFWLMQLDAKRLIARIAQSENLKSAEKLRFILRSFARLTVFGLLMFVAATKIPINVIGLVLGLSGVVISVVVIGLGAGRYRPVNKE